MLFHQSFGRAVVALGLAALLECMSPFHVMAQTYSSPDELLVFLKAQHQKIKAAVSDEPVGLQSLVDVSALLGLDQARIVSALGPPDHLSAADSAQTMWFYAFFKLQPHWRGGGVSLELTFDVHDKVVQSRWQGSR